MLTAILVAINAVWVAIIVVMLVRRLSRLEAHRLRTDENTAGVFRTLKATEAETAALEERLHRRRQELKKIGPDPDTRH